MSFLYQRTISFRRPGVDLAAGVRPYGVASAAEETVLAANIPAGVRDKGPGRRKPAGGAPDDRQGAGLWRILTAPNSTDPALAIVENDVVQDDLGRRFQVIQAESNGLNSWDILGELMRT